MYRKVREKIIKSIIIFISIFLALSSANASVDINSACYTSGNPYYTAELGGQCTAFAWGRACEKTGTKLLFKTQSYPSAKYWYEYGPVDSLNLETGTQIRADSIAIWEGDISNPYGHVAYVERVEDEIVYFNEANVETFDDSNWGGGYDGYEKSRHIDNFTHRGKGIGNILGYIYLKKGMSFNVDAALIIDSSGSMAWNDPMNLRKAAAKIFVHNADDDDQIAIVDFDSYANVLWPLQTLTANREGILSSIDRIDSSGGTDLGAGLLAGYNQLKASNKPYKKAAVFMTDGVGNYSNQSQLYLNDLDDPNDDWPVFTVGLGSGVNKSILQNIANTTGGIYFALSDPNQLQNVYFEIANLLKEGSHPLLNEITIMFVGSSYCTWVDVPTHQESVTFLITWPGSEVSASLISPSGKEIKPGTTDPDVYHAKGLTYELYRIANPEAGSWAINLYGVDLAPTGEEVRVSVSSVGPTAPVDTTPPVIRISNPVNGKTYFDQLPIDFHFLVEDPESASVDQIALLNGTPINNNDSILMTQPGEYTLTIIATNEANLTSEETITFYIEQFNWLPPIRYEAGSNTETKTLTIRANSTLPIKFAISDEFGEFVSNPGVKVIVEGTTAEFVCGEKSTDVRINEEDSQYIVNLHTNFNKWDYQMEIDGEYWITVYFDNILAAKTKLKLQ